jgi:hypothetical protein
MVNKRQQLNLRNGKESEFKIYCMENLTFIGITFLYPNYALFDFVEYSRIKNPAWLLKQDFRYFKIEFL